MINESQIFFLAIVFFITLGIFVLFYIFYKEFLKPNHTTIYHKGNNKLEQNIEKIDSRVNQLEETTKSIIKDISNIKRKLNIVG